MFAGSTRRPQAQGALSCVLFAGLLVASAVRAQEGTPPPPSPPPPDSTIAPAPPPPPPASVTPAMPSLSAPLPAGMDSTLALPLLIEPRSRQDINADLTSMSQLKAQAQMLVSQSKLRQARKQSQADIKKTEIASAKIQIDLAKKEKQAVQQKELEGTKKKLETQQKFLERLRDLHAAEAATQQATADFAQARMDECKMELKLYDLGDLNAAAVRMGANARSTQVRVTAALKERANKAGSLADAEKTQADRRKSVLDAYAEMIK